MIKLKYVNEKKISIQSEKNFEKKNTKNAITIPTEYREPISDSN